MSNTKPSEEWKKDYYNFCVNNGMTKHAADQAVDFVIFKVGEAIQATREETKITGETSDGYHTFSELYEFRKLYNAAWFNELRKDQLFNVHKSWRHNDGELCFGGGWFIVMATLPTGQISNHYEAKDWDLFNCLEQESADKWDGHTAQDVAKRISDFIKHKRKE